MPARREETTVDEKSRARSSSVSSTKDRLGSTSKDAMLRNLDAERGPSPDAFPDSSASQNKECRLRSASGLQQTATPTPDGSDMDRALEQAVTARLQERLLYLGWRKYRIPRDVCEDLFQAALLTYIEVRDRYPVLDEHPKILVGIFRNKCREHIDKHVRQEKKRRALHDSVRRGEVGTSVIAPNPSPDDGVVEDLVRREEETLIFEALAELRPEAREMFMLIVNEGISRKELIERYGLNKNTLDSRLHTYRKELRRLLARRGIHF